MALVIVADSAEELRAQVAGQLAMAGHEVRQAEDGALALLEIAQQEPQVLVIELTLARVPGLEVLRILHEEGLARNTRIVVYTNETHSFHVRRALNLGAHRVLEKAEPPEAVVDVVHEQLEILGVAVPALGTPQIGAGEPQMVTRDLSFSFGIGGGPPGGRSLPVSDLPDPA